MNGASYRYLQGQLSTKEKSSRFRQRHRPQCIDFLKVHRLSAMAKWTHRNDMIRTCGFSSTGKCFGLTTMMKRTRTTLHGERGDEEHTTDKGEKLTSMSE